MFRFSVQSKNSLASPSLWSSSAASQLRALSSSHGSNVSVDEDNADDRDEGAKDLQQLQLDDSRDERRRSTTTSADTEDSFAAQVSSNTDDTPCAKASAE